MDTQKDVNKLWPRIGSRDIQDAFYTLIWEDALGTILERLMGEGTPISALTNDEIDDMLRRIEADFAVDWDSVIYILLQKVWPEIDCEFNRQNHMAPDGDVFYTTAFFWDCKCDKDFIHPRSEDDCFECGYERDMSPPSRVHEVLKHKGKFPELVAFMNKRFKEEIKA
jgi:hypothetical protein